MAGGIKKIKWDGRESGAVIANMSNANSLITLNPGKFAYFTVGEWLPGTTEADKKKNRTWMWQNGQATTILRQMTVPSHQVYGVRISRKLSGPYTYFLDASITGRSNKTKNVGLMFRGYCPPLIVASKWSTSNDGADVRKTQVFSFGNIFFLNLETEGLNGAKVTVEIYNREWGDDRMVDSYPNIPVIDGEVNLEIRNSSTWKGKLGYALGNRELFVKVKINGKYVPDSRKDIAHARFLRVKNEVVQRHPEPPKNHTPLQVGEPALKPERFEPCKFDAVKITETEKKDGKDVKVAMDVFKKGQKLLKVEHPPEFITKTIFFDFDKFNINAEANKKLSNILGFLLEHEYATISIDGYACVIGKQNYNQGLSQRRSDAVKKFFADGKLDATRIISKGRGEINATDDKKGKDNIKYKDEKEYQIARRVDISFKFYGHDAQTIVYETVAPSTNKNIIIDITEHDTKACFREKGKHQKKIKVTSQEYTKPLEGGSSMTIPVKSDISAFHAAPLEFIWPKFNLATMKDSSVPYNLYVHSCRYFSRDAKTTVAVKAYPDIKWELAFELKIDIKHYSHTNMPAAGGIFEKHQKAAQKEGYKRWQMNKKGEVPITIGVGLKAEWDEGTHKASFTKDFEAKTELFAKTLSRTVELVQGAIEVCRGAAKASGIPVMVGVQYPKFEAVGAWNLQREPNHLQVAVLGEFSFGAKPLIGASVEIDLIAAAITVASYATTGSPAVTKIVERIRAAGKKVGAEIDIKAVFKGSLEIVFKDLKVNSITGIKGGSLIVGGSFGMQLIAEVKAGAPTMITNKVPILSNFKAIAKAQGDAFFGGEMKVESDKQGIFIQPTLKFSGLKVTLEAEVTVGWFSRSAKKEYDEVVPKKVLELGKKYIT